MTARLRIVAVNDVYVLHALPRLSSLIARARTVDPADALLVTVAGDFLAPSLLSSLDGGRGMAAAFDALGATHVTLGNHEDDLPLPELAARLAGLRARVVVSNALNLELRHAIDDVVEVGGHRVGILGLVEGDASLFRKPPFGGASFTPAVDVARREGERLRDAGCTAVVALTHQRLATDRLLAESGALDLICGGHEHEGYLELEHGTPLVKAPQNAAAAAVADLVLDGARRAEANVRLVRVEDYPEDPLMRALVDRLLLPVVELERRVLLQIPDGRSLTSAGSRHTETSLGTLVCSALRDALHAEVGIYNGGGLRGAVTHTKEFSYADLREELPFDNEVVVVRLPGAVLRDAIAYSRERLTLSGGFLHIDDHAVVKTEHALVTLAGAPLDEGRLYEVALVRDLLLGMDRVQPLIDHVARHPEVVPARASGQEVKVALLSVFRGQVLGADPRSR